MAKVATKKLFENDKIILWEMVLEPGESTGVHKHVRDYVVHVLEGAKLDVHDGKGKLLFSREIASGETAGHRLEGDEVVYDKGHRIPARHSATNVDKTRFREILIEMK